MSKFACIGFDESGIYESLSNHFEVAALTFVHNPQQSRLDQYNLILYAFMQGRESQFDEVRQLKATYSHIPIIMLAREYQSHAVLQAFRARALDFICLPGEIDYLVKRIDDLLAIRNQETYASTAREVIFPDQQPLGVASKNILARYTDNALTYIQKNYHSAIRIKDLADHCQMSLNRFSRLFKEEQDYTPREYIRRYRLEMAKQLLTRTSSSIEQVAFETGFGTVSLFNRLFREVVGYTPSGYRSSR